MIRFFISSTFKDMHDERDAIRNAIYPEIREYGVQKGVYVDYCDLRWGIDYNSEWSPEKRCTEIMRICFQEIEDCRPYIVAILGDYYGTIHSHSDQMVDLWKEFYDDSSLPVDKEISLTQWELEFSFLSNSKPDTRALCLFRKESGNVDKESKEWERSERLKSRLREKSSNNNEHVECRTYDGLDEYKTQFIEYAKQRIDEEAIRIAEQEKNWIEKDLISSRAVCQYRSGEFAGRSDYLDAFNSFVRSSDKNVLAFWGGSGIGKSSLMSRLYQETACGLFPSREVIMCGTSQKNSYYLNILLEVIYVLEKHLFGNKLSVRDNLYTESKAEEHLKTTLSRFDKIELKMLIFIDAMDKLSVEGTNKLVSIFTDSSVRNVKLICSQIDEYRVDNHRVDVREVTRMKENDIREILSKRLFDAHQIKTKKDGPIFDELLRKEGSFSPLYIKAVVDILKMHVADKVPSREKEAYYASIIHNLPEEVENVCWSAFEEAFLFVYKENKSNQDMMKDAVGLIALSRFGLREKDLECILTEREWNSLGFSAVRLFLRDFFRQYYDGCWTFEHDIIKKGVLEHLGEAALDKLRQRFGSYLFGSYDSNSELFFKEGMYLGFSLSKNDNENLDKVIAFLNRVGEYPELRYRETVAKELKSILQNEDPDSNWYSSVINRDMPAVMKALCSLLEVRKGKEYSRRLAAKYAVDLFWDICNINSSKDLEEWTNKTYNDQQLMAALCTEYIGISESEGDRNKAREFACFPKKFYVDRENFDSLVGLDRKRMACRHMDTLLCTNNNTLRKKNDSKTSDLEFWKEYSEDLISFLKEVNDEYKENYQGYLRNISSYYSAINEFDTAFRWKCQFLGEDINELFCNLDSSFADEKQAFATLSGFVAEGPIGIMDIDWMVQKEPLSSILHKLADYEENATREDNEKINKPLSAMANGYRVISYDCLKYLDRVESDYYLNLGCLSIEMAIMLFGSGFIDDDREKFSSYYRGVEFYIKRLPIDKETLDMVLSWGMKAIPMYVENPLFYGGDGKKLLEKLNRYDPLIQTLDLGNDYEEYYLKIKELMHSLDMN